MESESLPKDLIPETNPIVEKKSDKTLPTIGRNRTTAPTRWKRIKSAAGAGVIAFSALTLPADNLQAQASDNFQPKTLVAETQQSSENLIETLKKEGIK